MAKTRTSAQASAAAKVRWDRVHDPFLSLTSVIFYTAFVSFICGASFAYARALSGVPVEVDALVVAGIPLFFSIFLTPSFWVWLWLFSTASFSLTAIALFSVIVVHELCHLLALILFTPHRSFTLSVAGVSLSYPSLHFHAAPFSLHGRLLLPPDTLLPVRQWWLILLGPLYFSLFCIAVLLVFFTPHFSAFAHDRLLLGVALYSFLIFLLAGSLTFFELSSDYARLIFRERAPFVRVLSDVPFFAPHYPRRQR